MTRDDIKSAINEALDERRREDEATHRSDHEFVRFLKEERRARSERWEKVRQYVIGWSIVSVLGGIGLLAYHWFEAVVQAVINNGKGGP